MGLVAIALSITCLLGCTNSGNPIPSEVTLTFRLQKEGEKEEKLLTITGRTGEEVPKEIQEQLKNHLPPTRTLIERWSPTIPLKFPVEDRTYTGILVDAKPVTVTINLAGGTYAPADSKLIYKGYPREPIYIENFVDRAEAECPSDGEDFSGTGLYTFANYDHTDLQVGDNGGKTARWTCTDITQPKWNKDESNEKDYFPEVFPNADVTYNAVWKQEAVLPYDEVELAVNSKVLFHPMDGASFATSNPAVATVSGSLITASNTVGTTTITVQHPDYHDETLTVNTVPKNNDSLIRRGNGKDKRQFTFEGKSYTFNEVKTFHFKEDEAPAGMENNSNINFNPNIKSINSGTEGTWNPSDNPTGVYADVHVMYVPGNQTGTITIPKSSIGEFDYVEFSCNYWNNNPTITMKAGEAAAVTMKTYDSTQGNSAGLGLGEWTGTATSMNKDWLPLMRPAGSNGDHNYGSRDYIGSNERFMICGAWCDPTTKESILFTQRGTTVNNSVMNQVAVKTHSEKAIDMDGQENVVFTITPAGGNANIGVFIDYIAFYKLAK